ncbi:MAG: hypothetical protein AB7I59_03355 [Geminicoccaceae bacterium]
MVEALGPGQRAADHIIELAGPKLLAGLEQDLVGGIEAAGERDGEVEQGGRKPR